MNRQPEDCRHPVLGYLGRNAGVNCVDCGTSWKRTRWPGALNGVGRLVMVCDGCRLGWEPVDGRHYADVYSEARGRTDGVLCVAASAPSPAQPAVGPDVQHRFEPQCGDEDCQDDLEPHEECQGFRALDEGVLARCRLPESAPCHTGGEPDESHKYLPSLDGTCMAASPVDLSRCGQQRTAPVHHEPYYQRSRPVVGDAPLCSRTGRPHEPAIPCQWCDNAPGQVVGETHEFVVCNLMCDPDRTWGQRFEHELECHAPDCGAERSADVHRTDGGGGR